MATASDTPPPTQTPAPGPAKRPAPGAGGVGLLRRFLTLREGSIVVITLLAILYFSVAVSSFFTSSSFKSLLPFVAPYAIIAAGEVFVMILGEIDLSVGAVYLFTPFLWHSFSDAGLGLVPSMILALLVAMAIGGINGFFVAYVGIPSFVATLGTLFGLNGLTLIISHSTQVTTPGTNLTHTTTFASIFGGGTYSELFWAIGFVILLQIILSRTRWGLYTVAVGGNRLAASEAGIKVRQIKLRNFMMCSLLAGFVGVLEAVRVTTATPDPGSSSDYLFLSVAAVIIGGTLMTGGEGTVVGALLGALFLGVLKEGTTLASYNPGLQDFIIGAAILVAMVIAVYVSRIRKRSGIAG
jgi:simple sugar transport system permease protein